MWFVFWTIPILLWDGIRLIALVICLSPGFVRFAWYYYVSSHRQSIRFGKESCRQTLDVYHLKRRRTVQYHSPSTVGTTGFSAIDRFEDGVVAEESMTSRRGLLESDNDNSFGLDLGAALAPVIVFYTGGAWMIGYKMWGALLARVLTATGIVVVIPDTRNYPWASVPGMVDDVNASLDWTVQHIHRFGGNPREIVVVGQSAGGHIAATALLKRAIDSCLDPDEGRNYGVNGMNGDVLDDGLVRWKPKDFKGFVSLSAPYNLNAMQQTFLHHGLGAGLVARIFGGEQDNYDPHKMVCNCARDGPSLKDVLPPIRIYHGSLDKTVPPEGSEEFYIGLRSATVAGHGGDEEEGSRNQQRTTFLSYDGWSHTDPILEGPMDADNRFHYDLFEAVNEWTDDDGPHLAWPENDPIITNRLCPHILVNAGRYCNPF